MEKIKEKIVKLRELINYHNKQYFIKENPKISDGEYDQLMVELKELEKQYPQYYDSNSPTQKIGGYAENTFDEVIHKVPMLSLGKKHCFEEFKKWFIDMHDKKVNHLVFETKFDGLAVSLLYKNGKLIRGATRGNGLVGEDITATIMTVPNIPKIIPINEEIEVRGEVILLKSGFDSINVLRKFENKKPYKNVRNAASGIIRTKNPTLDIGQHLKFATYDVNYENKPNGFCNDHNGNMGTLTSLGFQLAADLAPSYGVIINSYPNIDSCLNDINNYFNEVKNIRDNLDFDIDGIVIKTNLYSDQERLGNKTYQPEWAIAYKFEAEERISILNGVEWLLGAKRNVTPRARIKPVDIGGTTIIKPTLHNIDEIKELEVKIGDTIVVSRRGDVIPKIERVVKELRTGNEENIEIPIYCPECNTRLVMDNAYLRCENPECDGMVANKIENYIKALEIESFGPKVIQKLVDENKISSVPDIYNLKTNDISNLERMGQKSATKIINNVKNSKNAPLYQVIYGLTIKGVGKELAKLLQKKYKTIDKFSKAKYEELINMDGVGPILGDNIINWLSKPINQEIIQKLSNIGIGMKIIEKNNEGLLKDKVFAFTGKLSKSRNEIKQIIEENGGINSSNKKGIDYFLIGNGAKQHKIDKAKKNGAQVINEEEFWQLLN
ncbi:MAG: NAD-dependent DNA ligase LigA [archaeon]